MKIIVELIPGVLRGENPRRSRLEYSIIGLQQLLLNPKTNMCDGVVRVADLVDSFDLIPLVLIDARNINHCIILSRLATQFTNMFYKGVYVIEWYRLLYRPFTWLKLEVYMRQLWTVAVSQIFAMNRKSADK